MHNTELNFFLRRIKLNLMSLDPEKIQRVITDVFEGLSLTEALLKHGVKRQAFYNFKADNLKCDDEYTRARFSRIELMVEEIIKIADNPEIDPNRARNMIAARQWTASKLVPHVYGDRLEVNVTKEISLVDAIAEGRARVLALRGPDTPIDSQAIELKTNTPNGPTGLKPADESESTESKPDQFAELLK